MLFYYLYLCDHKTWLHGPALINGGMCHHSTLNLIFTATGGFEKLVSHFLLNEHYLLHVLQLFTECNKIIMST